VLASQKARISARVQAFGGVENGPEGCTFKCVHESTQVNVLSKALCRTRLKGALICAGGGTTQSQALVPHAMKGRWVKVRLRGPVEQGISFL